jgi:hypothetical protein
METTIDTEATKRELEQIAAALESISERWENEPEALLLLEELADLHARVQRILEQLDRER